MTTRPAGGALPKKKATARTFHPSRARGQCFLTDSKYIGRVIEEIAPERGEAILEIGAGAGQLTIPLAQAGARVTAVESDNILTDTLRSKLRDHPELDVSIVHTDFFRLELESWLSEQFETPPRVCGNLPYSVASAILLALLEHPNLLKDMTLMFQLEVAERLVAEPGTKAYGFLSVRTQQCMSAEIALEIPPHAFRPRPRVHSALAKLTPRGIDAPDVGDTSLFDSIVKGLFTHRRKTISNNLAFFRSLGLQPDQVRTLLENLGIAASLRAEMLSVDAFAEISRHCASLR